MIDNDWPFFINNTGLVKSCLLDSDCDGIDSILKNLGLSFVYYAFVIHSPRAACKLVAKITKPNQSYSISDERGIPRVLSLHPIHLTPDDEGNLPPSALVPFCSYHGDRSLLGSQSQIVDNETLCDKFELKILEGQRCFSLDVAKMIGKTKTGRANGLFLLLDPNPYQLNITEENVPSSKDQSFKVIVHTLAQFTTYGSGSYAMSALKKMTGTNSFLQLPEEDKMCFVHDREDCQTQKYLKQVHTKCKCIPWALKTDKNKNQVKEMS